ncbi:MAG TPA: hypothetical protein PLN69_09970, partial [bacterium]|nr:hypothetical protein [bacterium]
MTVLRIRNVLPATIFMLYSLCIFCAGAFAADVVIRIDSSAEPCISHGAEKLGEALESKKLSVQIGSRSITGDEFTVFLGTPESDWTGDIENALPSVSEKAESYSLAVLKDKNIIIATGSDAVGAMYSAYELAEQVRDIADGKDIPAGLENTTGEPFLEIRAVNPFLHVDALTDPGSWYFKDEFWETYLDLLSESRYNLIDFHAMYDVNTTWFPNAFIFLVKSEKYPDVGLPAEESER